MEETISTIYLGDLRTEATHVQSGTKLVTDAPVDNQGKGEFFSPTDLLAASLTSCILTIMGIKARENNFSIKSAKAKTWKIMGEKPRRVAEVKIEFDFSMCQLTDGQKEILESLVKISPVPLSLHPETLQSVSIKF